MDKLGHLALVVLAGLTVLTGLAMVVTNIKNLNKELMLGGGAMVLIGFAMGWGVDFDKAAAGAAKLTFWRKTDA